MWRSMLLVALGGLAGAGGVVLLRGPATVTTREIRDVERASAPVVRCTATLSDEQIAALRDDIVAHLPAHAELAPPAPPPGADAAATRANEVASAALARGTWTDEDVAAFRRELPNLDQARLQEVMSKITAAINDGRLHATAAILF